MDSRSSAPEPENFAAQYDAWYDSRKGRTLLELETDCLRPLVQRFPRPCLEVGVGTGRFAAALDVEYGVDPSEAALEIARRREITVAQGIAEDLPFEDSRFGCVLFTFSLCFVADPVLAFAEAHRVLTKGGGVVLGLLLRGTPWADEYARRGAQGHPIYRSAQFHSLAEIESLLARARFHIVDCSSSLFQPPGVDSYEPEESVPGCRPGAGFTAIAAARV